MTATIAPPLFLQEMNPNNSGAPAAGFKVFTYLAGSSTKQATWTDSTQVTPNANPIILDSQGGANVWGDPSIAYKIVWAPANDTDPPTSPIRSVDNVYFPINLGALTQAVIGKILYPQTSAEAAAGVTPTNYAYEPYNVLRYGAVGDGSTDDTAAFNSAGSIGHVITVPESPLGATYVLSSLVSGLFMAKGLPRFSTTFGRIGLVDEPGTVNQDNNGGIIGSFPGPASVVVIGDSITQGAGASTYQNAWGWLFGRSLMNHAREGIFADSGMEYHSLLDFSKITQTPGVTTTGSTSVTGIWGTRLALSSGQNIAFTLREARSISIIYNANGVAGTLQIQLNGTLITGGTINISGSAGLTETGFIVLKANNIMTRLGDTITVACTSGAAQICAIILAKNSNSNAMIAHVGAQTGYAYQDYTSAGNVAELAFYLNAAATLGAAQSKVLICQLGTNNIYNNSKALSPANTVAQISSLITQVLALCTNLVVVISVPYKANEGTFPVILSQYRYEDYVRAIVAYAKQNNFTLLRNDQSPMSTQQYLSDGLHPTNIGHTMLAATAARALNIKYDKFFKSVDYPLADYVTQVRPADGNIVYNSTWATLGGGTALQVRAHLVAGIVYLSGVANPTGSVSTTIGTLPAGFRPDVADRFFIVPVNVGSGTLGFARIAVRTTGNVDISTVPTNDVALDGIAFPLNKYIEA